MKQEKQQQAQHLYFQTDLSKSEIASMLGISRRTLHYWVRNYNWDHIKKSAAHLPSQLAENCYYIMAKMQDEMLSEERSEKAPTYKEVNALYKLTLTINKLKTRNTLNETLELGAHFMEYVNDKNPEDADFIKSYIDGYIVSRAASQPQLTIPARTKEHTPATEQEDKEARLDLEDLACWNENSIKAGMETETKTVHPTNTGYSIKEPPPFSSTHNRPQNEKFLNRAQRRQLARTKAVA